MTAFGPAVTWRRLVGALALGALGAAANCYPIQPFPGIALALGGIASIYASLTLGPLPAMLTAAVAFLPTVHLWEQPLALTLAVSEAAVFSYLYFCRRLGNLRSFGLFWFGLGLPLVYVVAWHYAVLPEPTRWIVLIKYPLNSLLALLVATVLLRVRPLAVLTDGIVPPREERLERLLFSTYAPVVLAPLLIFAVSVGSFATNRYLKQQDDTLRRAADDIAGDLGETLAYLQTAVADAAADIASQGPSSAGEVLAKFHRSYPRFGTMLFANATGDVEHSVGTLQGRSVSRDPAGEFSVADREYFKVPMATGRVFVSNGFKGRGLGSDLIFAISAPVPGPTGRPAGVVEASILLQAAASGNQPLVRRWSDRQFAVLDGSGRVILSSPEAGFHPLENLQIRFGLTPHGPGNIQPEFVENVMRSGSNAEVVLRSTAPVPGQSWHVVVDLPLREVLRQAGEGYAIAVFWTALAWLLALAVTRVVSAQITRPFRYLAAVSSLNDTRLAEASRTPPEGMPVELVELSRELAHSRHEIKRANQELRAALGERDESNHALRRLSVDLERQVAARTADLEVARRRAEAASRVKSEFVAHMSHELRTPLNVILGSVRIMERDPAVLRDPAHAARLRQITASGDLLRNLIEDVLDLAKIESGALEIDPAPLDAAQIVRDCTALLEPNATAKGLRLRLAIAVPDGTMITDQRRLQQILLNLLNNAVKFTPGGGTVEVALRPTPDRADYFTFAVTDDGIGLDPAELARLFEPFVRGAAAKASGEPGTGLGLPLVKRIAEHLQGTVTVVSRPGAGSCFSVALPRFGFAPGGAPALQPDPRIPAAAPVAKPARRTPCVLIAEDHAPNATILAEICELEGLDSRIAVNGLEAVQLAGELLPDVILMDWRMPLLEGPEAIQRIKADARTAHIPVIALTAYAQPQDAARMTEVGAMAYLTKPIDFDRLLQLFTQLGLIPAAANDA